jgi:proteasome lid subunit RPN8/RPN11
MAARTKYGEGIAARCLEVAGFARAHAADGVIIVDDVLVPPQDVGGAHADVEVEDLDWLMSTVLARGEQPKEWFVWWHSHVNMSTSPSSTDHNTLTELAKQARAGFAIGLVINIKGEATGWAVYESPMMKGHYVEQSLPVELSYLDEALAPAVADMMSHVVETKWMPTVQGKPQGTRGNPREQASLDEALVPTGYSGYYDGVNFSKEFKRAAWDRYLAVEWGDLTDDEMEAVLEVMTDGEESLDEDLFKHGTPEPALFYDGLDF